MVAWLVASWVGYSNGKRGKYNVVLIHHNSLKFTNCIFNLLHFATLSECAIDDDSNTNCSRFLFGETSCNDFYPDGRGHEKQDKTRSSMSLLIL